MRTHNVFQQLITRRMMGEPFGEVGQNRDPKKVQEKLESTLMVVSARYMGEKAFQTHQLVVLQSISSELLPFHPRTIAELEVA
jgi:hypothetical protein